MGRKKKIEVEAAETAPATIKVATMTRSGLRPLGRGVKITFYRFGCGCGKENVRAKIRNLIRGLGHETWNNYRELRVEYDPDWQAEARALGITNCAFHITWPDGETRVVSLPDFLENYL